MNTPITLEWVRREMVANFLAGVRWGLVDAGPPLVVTQNATDAQIEQLANHLASLARHAPQQDE